MRLQLKGSRARVRLGATLAVWAATVAAPARAEDQVTVRGAYYRETSTRVVQPVVEVAKDLPDNMDLKATYLLDAITSASVAAGTNGSDSIFTELRNEVGMVVGWNPRWGRHTLAYRYSAESDYWSHILYGSGQFRLWGDTGLLAVGGGVGRDGVWPRGQRTPACPTQDQRICYLWNYFLGVGYTQVLSPVLVAQANLDGAFLDGMQDAIYRSVPNKGYEQVPRRRWRGSASGRVAYYLPPSRTGLQLAYRYYRDSWSIGAHMVEGRVFQTVARDLELRLSFRYYRQSPSYFWCDWMLNSECYSQSAAFYTADPKLQPVNTEMPEVKLYWDAARLRGVPFLGWFAEGSFEISYAYYIQNTTFGNAHLLQMGYTLPY